MATPAVTGCGGEDEAEARKPDTGYGADQVVPSARTCADLCARLGDCAARLCNEDTKSTRYDPLAELIRADCERGCSQTLLESSFTESQWQCLFESSCRQVLDYDDCNADGSYYCN